MKHITFYLDFISPYAYLAFEQLPQALKGLSYRVDYRPVLFAGLAQAPRPARPGGDRPKRDWTYRQVLWLAHAHGIPMQMPAAHPFNPLGLLRLALACGPNRYVCERSSAMPGAAGRRGGSGALAGAAAATAAGARSRLADDVKAELKASGATPSRAACSACRPSPSTASCSGASTR
jgi:hypothetical protein